MRVISTMRASLVCAALILATHFAAGLYCQRVEPLDRIILRTVPHDDLIFAAERILVEMPVRQFVSFAPDLI